MNRTIRILVLGMADVVGGVENVIMQVYRRTDPDMIHFDYLTFFDKCAYEDELIAGGSSVFHITRRGTNPFRSRKELTNFFKEHGRDYDFIWINTCSASNILAQKLAKRFSSAKIVTHSHCAGVESRNALLTHMHGILNRINNRAIVKYSDKCLTCSSLAGEWLFGKNPDKPVTVIPNGIQCDDYEFDENIRRSVREEIGVGDQTVIGFVGRLKLIKNPLLALDIFFEYHKLNPNSVMVFVGDGNLKEEIVQKIQQLGIEKHVKLLGFRKDVQQLLHGVDALLQPSRAEGFPLTLIEAQSCGIPCLISDTIAKEVKITELTEFCSLSAPPSEWAKSLHKLYGAQINRHGFSKIVKKCGYDISDTVRSIQNVFLENDFKEN